MNTDNNQGILADSTAADDLEIHQTLPAYDEVIHVQLSARERMEPHWPEGRLL